MSNIDMSVAEGGKRRYDQLESRLLATARGQYVAIEPVSGEYFIGASMGEAIAQGRTRYPQRPFYTVAVGKPVHITPR